MTGQQFNRETEDQLDIILQQAALDHDPGEVFDKGVLRRVNLDRHARTIKFWMPAIVGALIAGIAVLSAVEVVCLAPARRPASITGQEAKANPRPAIPDFKDPSGVSEVK